MYALATYFVLAGLTVIAAVLLSAHTWEHRRYARRRCDRRADRPAADELSSRVAVIVPCKGAEFELADHLTRLLNQDYPDYEVHFVVESSDDPACGVIQSLMSTEPAVPVRLIVAGQATDCGQKIHNLLVATGKLDASIETLVFVDSDASPESDWLRHLVSRLVLVNVNAVTSYRWFVPQRATLANLLLFSINSAAMALVCTRRQAVLWGGTWAVRRDVFEQTGISVQWQRRLSDDLVASQRLDKMRLNVDFEPRCVVTSPIDYRGLDMLEFLRRQCYVGRWYRTRYWVLGVVYTTASMATFWGGLGITAIGIWNHSPGTWVPSSLASAAMWGMAAVRAHWRQDVGRLFVRQDSSPLRAARIFDVLAYPLGLTVAWIGLISAAIGRKIQWRNIGYYMHRDRTVDVIPALGSARANVSPYVAASWAGHRSTIAAAASNDATFSLYGSSAEVSPATAPSRRSA